ncbi:Mediator of RNA polymerase II transcription subunit 10, partial [Fragariocoptes setiger]
MDQLESQIELFVENVRQLGIIVSDFQVQSGQAVLNQKINQVVTSLNDIDRLKGSVQDIQVPLEVFDYIDKGRNPQFFTKDCMEQALTKNEEVRGKIDYYKRFKKQLIDELNKVFPNEVAKYLTCRPQDPRTD